MERRNSRTGGGWLAASLLAVAGCHANTASLEPLAWQKVAGSGPGGALLEGATGAFDERGMLTVSVFKDGDTYRLYYGGVDATFVDPACAAAGPINDSHWRVGLATSSDGVHFTRDPGGAILDIGAPGDFDSFMAYRPFVLKDGAVYRMWYNGSDHPFNCPLGTLAKDRRIGYAESSDGVHFTKDNTGPGPDGSVLPLGNPGEFDAQQVGYMWVLKDGDQFKMYYSASDSAFFWRVGLAVSTDARTWTKVRGRNSNGSVLDLGPPGSLDAACAYQPSVVKEGDGLYRMWYRACSAPGRFGGPGGGTIGYAESNDGISWVKIPQDGPQGSALGAGAAGQFDSAGLTTPSVFIDGSSWDMYYAGFDANGVFLPGLAKAAR